VTDEAGDARGVADGRPGLVGEVHPDEQVAGQLLAGDLLALAALDLGDLLGGHLDLEDVVLDVQRADAALEVGLDLVLVAGVGVDDVPVARQAGQHLLHLFSRVEVALVLLSGGRGPRVGGRVVLGVRCLGAGLGAAPSRAPSSSAWLCSDKDPSFCSVGRTGRCGPVSRRP
jgi:hypothetical protein